MWIDAAILILALLGGFVGGWSAGKALRLSMPNAAAATVVLTAGSWGAPVLTYTWLGAHLWSYAIALVIAGAAAGLTFWPMGQTQGERQWF